MWFRPDQLLLTDRIDLYNNIASSGDCTGRLSSHFIINPTPRLIWEFESVGDLSCNPKETSDKLDNSLTGSRFCIREAYITAHRVGDWDTILLRGVSAKAYLGNVDDRYEYFRFYLPNTKFLELCISQEMSEKYVKDRSSEGVKGPLGEAYRSLEVALDQNWNVCLTTNEEALDWLRNKESTGTLLTTSGELWTNTDEPVIQPINSPDGITVDEALEKVELIGSLLAFANGGYLNPLYLEGVSFNKGLDVTAIAANYRITPIQRTGNSWIVYQSDLRNYLRCYATLTKMTKGGAWEQTFRIVLIWYLQAIQPEERGLGKSWPIVANALGAALERLSYTILVQELKELSKTKYGKSKLTEHIKLALERIGIRESIWTSDYKLVDEFVKMRNDATHPEQNKTWGPEEVRIILGQAVQWVEEILLWRLGYDGKYINRSQRYFTSMDKRYDLVTREPTW